MKIKDTARHTLIGILLGLLLTPGLLTPPPVQAQFLTFDKPSFLLKIEEMSRHINEWMDTQQGSHRHHLRHRPDGPPDLSTQATGREHGPMPHSRHTATR